MNSLRTSAVRGVAIAAAAFALFSTPARAQEAMASASSPAETTSAVHDLQDQVRLLRTLVDEMRAENAQSRAEMQQLRHDLEATRALLERPASPSASAIDAVTSQTTSPANDSSRALSSAASASLPQDSHSLEERVQKLEESTSLIGSKIDEQYQTKVESASKYRARVHGMVLMNAFRTAGAVDSLDLPTYAQMVAPGTSTASLGATLRQSELGLEVFGPTVFGAKTSADVQFDFAGGFPNTGNGVNFGIARLQTASLRFDWQNTSVVAGQDALFISPLSPTSFASLALPAFAFAGNLWAWTPQLRVEHRFSLSDQQTVTVQAGIMDNLDWEFPATDLFNRPPQSGEASGQPAYAVRTAWSHPVWDHPLSFGVAGYYGRQNWNWNRYVDAWAGMADWQIPLLPRLGLSGEFYRGRGIGGLGGAFGTSVLFGGDMMSRHTPIHGYDAAGGWAQLKFQLTPKIEFNGVIAEDDGFASDVRGFATDANNFGLIVGRNRGALGNVIFRPRSDLVLAAEFKRLRSYPVYSPSNSANQASLAVGVLF